MYCLHRFQQNKGTFPSAMEVNKGLFFYKGADFMMNLGSCKIHYKRILEIMITLNQIKMNFV